MDTEKFDFLNDPLIVINIGVRKFAESLSDQEVDVIHIDWTPPAGGDEEMIGILDELI